MMRKSYRRLCYAVVFLFLSLSDGSLLNGESVHIIFNTDCSVKFGWQSLALLHSIKRSGQQGPVTRLLSCTPEELEAMDQETLDLFRNYYTPSFAVDPDTGDYYPPYNRPKAISLWLEEIQPQEEWLIVIDPDMLIRHPVTFKNLMILEGFASASPYEFLSGCNGPLGERHIPELPAMLDVYGGPEGRRCDYVGALMAVKTIDMAKIAPLWFEYSKKVRDDPEAWNVADEPDMKPGDKPWIAEMYGYAFAAAKVGVRHALSYGLQNYPAYSVEDTATSDIASVLHYTLEFSFLNYTFNKHNHEDFDYTVCPTEDTIHGENHGLFPHPPHPSEVYGKDDFSTYDQLLGIETVNTINDALCRRHLAKCQPSKSLSRACEVVASIRKALSLEEERLYKSGALCSDFLPECQRLSLEGKCYEMYNATSVICRSSCEFCAVIDGYSEVNSSVLYSSQNLGSFAGDQAPISTSGLASRFLAWAFLTVVIVLYVVRFRQRKQIKSK